MPRDPKQPNLRAVPNNDESPVSRRSLKEIIITSAVTALSMSGAVGLAVWILRRGKKMVSKEETPPPQQLPQQVVMQQPYMAPGFMPQQQWVAQPMMVQQPMAQNFQDMLPDALRMQPNIQTSSPGARRRRAAPSGDAPSWFRDYEAKQNQRLDALERKLEESFVEGEEFEES